MYLEKDGKGLYAVALEKYNSKTKQWRPELQHIHAESAAHAEFHYKVMYPNRRLCRIIAAGPAIGFYVEDKIGMVVSAQ